MEEERDLVVFSDDEGNEKTMEVLDYFFYEGQEYAVLTEADDECDSCGEECECGEEADAYIMKVVPSGDDEEEFLPVEDELMDRLIEFVQNELYADDEDEEEEEDGEDKE